MPITMPRRARRALPALALVALIAIAGCAAPGDADPDETPAADESSNLLPPAEGTTEYPLTLSTWAGETVLEERPERIAVIGFSTNLDFVEALDATPVYTLTEESEWEWRDQQWFSGIEFIDTATRRDPINFEAIAATTPDLIVTLNFFYEQGDYERLTEIAPVLDYAEQLGDQADWREGQRLVGEALDLSASAEQAIADADAAIDAVAEAHPEFDGKTVTIATEYDTGLQYYTVTGGTAESFLLDLGFAPNPLAESFVDDPNISDEHLGLLDADALVVTYFDEAAREAREGSALFQAIPAVADGRYAGIAGEQAGSGANAIWVLRRGASTLSMPWAAEVVADQWLADIDLR